jgi:hypothetical protein
MARTLNLFLTDELRKVVDEHSGKGTHFATASEFVLAVLCEKKERLEAAKIRDAILEGYQDVMSGRTVEYQGNLRVLLKKR